jgi:hypothetical protein
MKKNTFTEEKGGHYGNYTFDNRGFCGKNRLGHDACRFLGGLVRAVQNARARD